MSKKILAVVMAAAMAMTGLAGCQGKGTSTAATGGDNGGSGVCKTCGRIFRRHSDLYNIGKRFPLRRGYGGRHQTAFGRFT